MDLSVASKKLTATLGKRHRIDESMVYLVPMDKDHERNLMDNVKNYVWPVWIFIANKEEEILAMILLLRHSRDWKLNDLGSLNEGTLHLQGEEYVNTFGQALCKSLNGFRNDLQQKTRKVWIDLYKEGKAITAAQFLKVAQRPAHLLLLLPEKDEHGKKIQDNIKRNKENKKYRERFQIWVSMFLPLAAGPRSWGMVHFCHNTPSDYKIVRSGKADRYPITPGLEAIMILFMFNAQKKWIYEADWEKRTKEDIKQETRKLKAFKKKLPATEYSTKAGGAVKYGGWYDEGRKKFATVRSLIRMGRSKNTTKKVETETMLALRKKHQADLPQARPVETRVAKIDLRGAGVGAEDETDDELVQEGYDSEEELNNLKLAADDEEGTGGSGTGGGGSG